MTSGPPLPVFGHPLKNRVIRVEEPIGRATYIEKGRHLILGQRDRRGRTDSLILFAKCIERTKVQDRYDANVWLDASFPHVVFISGTRGSGKSFDIGVLVEGLLLEPAARVSTEHTSLSVVVFDLQNQFWTLSRAPQEALPEDIAQVETIRAWGLEARGLPQVELYSPRNIIGPIGTEHDLVLAASALTPDDLCSFWGTDAYSPQGHLIGTLIDKVANTGYVDVSDVQGGPVHVPPVPNWDIGDLIRCLLRDEEIDRNVNQQVIEAVLWRLQSLERTGLFQSQGIPVEQIVNPGRAHIILLRSLDDATKALVVGILLRRIYGVLGDYHTRRRIDRRLGRATAPEVSLPMRLWAVIDEAHVICPTGKSTSATVSAIEYVKRGRDAGLSLVLATQQPSAVDTRVLSQVDLSIVHRLTFEGDISSALARIPAALPATVSLGTTAKEPRSIVRLLESGEAIIGDSQCDRAIVCQVRPRLTAHGGAEPT